MKKEVIFGVGPEFLARAGLAPGVAPWEDGQRAPTAPGSFEWWYFDAHFEDGTTAVIVYATKPIINPGVPLTPNLSITITEPGGLKHVEFALPPAGAFSASREGCQVHIGPSWVKHSLVDGAWVYDLHAETASLSADLRFSGLVPPWRPGAGMSFFGDLEHYFAWLPAIPHGTVSGSLTAAGRSRSLQGTGYHDHNWGNISLPAVMDHWTWGRAHLSGYTLIFVEQVTRRGYGARRLPVFLLAKGKDVLVEDPFPLRMEARDLVSHPGGRTYPQEVDFHWQRGQERVDLLLRQPQLIEAVSLLGALPPLQRRLARLVANPYYFRFNTSLDLSIHLDGVAETVHGSALYEIMLLR